MKRDKEAKQNKNFFSLAFTLAEVLIVMGIIGIIAEMTLPSLIQSYQKTVYVVKLKKAYSTLTNAYDLLVADYDDIDSAVSHFYYVVWAFESKMNISKNCGLSNGSDTGCFPNISYQFLKGGNYDNFTSAYYTFITADGMAWAADSNTNCDTDSSGGDPSNPLYSLCTNFFVDLNGPNKGPAQFGRDMFLFNVTRRGVFPAGVYYNSWETLNDCNTSDAGMTCASRVLKEGAINY